MIRFWCGGTSNLALLLTVAFSPLLQASAETKSVFKAGFAERDISPAVGMEQPGGYGKAYHQSFHDPCKVRAVVFDDGTTRVAIVGIDALFIRRQTVQSIRTAIEKKCGIEPRSILISASHTHSGGPIGYYLPGEFDDASPLVRSLVNDRTVWPTLSTSPRWSRQSWKPCPQPIPGGPRPGAAWDMGSRIRSRSIAGSG